MVCQRRLVEFAIIKDMDFLLELFSGRLFLAAVKGEKL